MPPEIEHIGYVLVLSRMEARLVGPYAVHKVTYRQTPVKVFYALNGLQPDLPPFLSLLTEKGFARLKSAWCTQAGQIIGDSFTQDRSN